MLKKTKFKQKTKVSESSLKKRITYISDTTHENHTGKTILAARNYRCEDQSAEAFETKALQIFQKYKAGREGKVGKRTSKLFEEFIYSSAPGSFLTTLEKNTIEHALITNALLFTSCRTVWHDDPKTGRCDLHILAAAYTDDVPPRVHLSFGFGHGERDFLLTLERAERDALDLINEKRDPSKRILSAREAKKINMREAKVLTLAEKLSAIWDGSKDTLVKALTGLGYTITKFTDKNISVVSPGTSKPRRYNVGTLRDNVEDISPDTEKVVEKELEVTTPVRSVSRATKVDKWKKKYKGEAPQAPKEKLEEKPPVPAEEVSQEVTPTPAEPKKSKGGMTKADWAKINKDETY